MYITNDNLLTFLIPTCNRYDKLNICIQSIRKIYTNSLIIICDNSENTSLHTNEEKIIKSKYNNIKYLNLRTQAYDLLNGYIQGIKHVTTPYTFVIDDDDQLYNASLHSKCFAQLSNSLHTVQQCISFGALKIIKNNILYLLNDFPESIIHNNIPVYWNGNFQTGTMYYPTKLLYKIIEYWSNNHLERTFDLSHDEVFALYCIYNSHKYIHFNDAGLRINHHGINTSLNPYLAIYSSRSYIDFLQQILGETTNWANTYKMIQLNDLQEQLQKPLTYNDVFNNINLFNIEKYIIQYINTHSSYKECRAIITSKVKTLYG